MSDIVSIMFAQSFEVPSNQKILVISSIFDQVQKLSSIRFQDYSLVLVNGNLCFPFHDLSAIENRIETISSFSSNLHYNLGPYDLVLLSKLKKENRSSKIASWILNRPNVSFCSWPSSSSVIVSGGGVPETKSKIELDGNMTPTFLSLHNGKPWQEFYRGQIGYGIGNHPLSDDPPEFFDFAARIGGKYRGKETKIWAQEVGEHGLLKTFALE